MRVLELTDLYRPAIGGLERFVALLSQTLTQRGHEVRVVTAAVAGEPRLERQGDVTVHRLPLTYQRLGLPLVADPARPFHPPARDPAFGRGLRQIVEDFHPDVIHAHSWSVHSALGRSLAVPVMVTAHDYGLACAKKSLVDRGGDACPGPSLRRCPTCAAGQYGTVKGAVLAVMSNTAMGRLRRVTTFTAVSDYVAGRLTPILEPLTGRPVQTLHSFVPDGLFELGSASPAPDYLPTDPDDPSDRAHGEFLLYAGQLSTHKGIDVLLDAYQRLSDTPAGSRPPLVLLGTTHPSFSTSQRLPEGVVVRTDVDHTEVMAAMVRAACVVVPSQWPEPLPMIVSEAHNCGVPTVASNVGGIPEQMVDGVTGHLVPPGDPAALAARLSDVLRSRRRAQAMGRAARRQGRMFTASYAIAAVERVLEETVDRHTASSLDLPAG